MQNEISAEDRSAAILELRSMFLMAPRPVPEEALNKLFSAACQDTGGSQAARRFLFWLAGKEDPTGFQGNGGLELRRLDREHKEAAFQLLHWWAGPTQSDEPLYGKLRALAQQFSAKAK